MLPLVLGSMAASAIGSALAAKSAKGEREDAAKRARSVLGGQKIPSLEEARSQLDLYVQMGLMSPEEAEAQLQEQTAYAQIEEDPRLRASQIDALTELEGIADSGGMDARLRSALGDVSTQQMTESRGAQDAIMANARERGIAGSDLESVNRMVVNQAAATRAAQQGTDAAAIAEQRRMQALTDQAEMAGGVRSADYAKKANEAAARDTINRFNTSAKQSVNNANVDAANRAQALNLGERQRAADANVQERNRLPQQLRELDANKRAGMAKAEIGVGTGAAADSVVRANAEEGGAQMGSSLFRAFMGGSGASGAGAASMGGGSVNSAGVNDAFYRNSPYTMSDERAKTDIKPLDAEALLEEISGITFRYKDPANGEGEQTGLSAQDVERAAPGAVVEGDDGLKRLDNGKIGALTLAALADVHDRVKNLEGRRNG